MSRALLMPRGMIPESRSATTSTVLSFRWRRKLPLARIGIRSRDRELIIA
jgi:hypothetical protein